MLRSFEEDQRFQLDFINEYAIMSIAYDQELKNIMPCRNVLLGINHIALEMRTY